MPEWLKVVVYIIVLALCLTGELVESEDTGRMFLAMAISITAAWTTIIM